MIRKLETGVLVIVLLTTGISLGGCANAGPREAKLNAQIEDMKRGGQVGNALLADSRVKQAVNEARTVCRSCDQQFGQSESLDCEQRVFMAHMKVMEAMAAAGSSPAGHR